ncbi:tyrosine-type recombinase/integrase [Streptomyces hydrogenans]|uniref:tyrosine-type recombinase/integrase n=1 Tax=Streptomyces hydrogenans TaxID=1873719 RepID=UPI0035E08924
MNANNIVGQDVYRVRERIHSNTLKLAKLKHRKAGEFQEVPLPRSVGEAIERYVDKYGTTPDGHLLRGPGGYFTEDMERRRVKKLFEDFPPEEGVGMYGFRHYFASNALGSGIPITDVAERMGHKSIEETYRAYRHLMPGSITKAARILDAGLWEAAGFHRFGKAAGSSSPGGTADTPMLTKENGNWHGSLEEAGPEMVRIVVRAVLGPRGGGGAGSSGSDREREARRSQASWGPALHDGPSNRRAPSVVPRRRRRDGRG